MSIVLDASVAIEWFISGEQATAAREVARQILDQSALVPQLWPLEVANVLSLAVRKQVISAGERTAAFDVLRSMAIELDGDTSVYAWTRTTELADRHGLTLYDASYLELALRTGLSIATLDKALIRAARAESLPVLP